MKIHILLFLILWFLPACSGKNTTDNSDDQDDIQILKSAKRGLAYNLTDSLDLESLQEGVSWWYNWYYKTDAPTNYNETYQMEFIPMVWGASLNTTERNALIGFIIQHPEIKYLLVLNEPNLTDQANRTPAQAANDWLFYEQIVDDLAKSNREIKLVGPAMHWGTMTDYWDPVVWLDAFYEAYKTANGGNEPLIDYLAFHWYDYGLEAQLNRLAKYGKKIWITEMANWNAQINSYEKQAQQMREMVAICENRDDVFRYAWFIGRGDGLEDKYTCLFTNTPGQLTSLGELYISLPYSDNE